MNALLETLKKNIFLAAPGLVVVALVAAGLHKGFNLAHVLGIAAMFAFHHKDSIAAIFQREAPQLPPQVEAMLIEYENFKKTHADQIASLQTELSKTNMVLALKTGLLKPQAPQGGA